MAELGGNHEDSSATEQTRIKGTVLSFFPTVAVTESSMEAFTVKPETHTYVSFIPNNLPDVISSVTSETLLTEEEVQGHAKNTAEILPPETVEETTTDIKEEPEVQEILQNNRADEGGAGPGELLPGGKSTYDFFLKWDL